MTVARGGRLPPDWVPPISVRDLAVAVLGALLLWPVAFVLTRNGDEGIFVYGAQRVLEGEMPYRDFQECVTPGSWYWLALWFRVFGLSFATARWVLLGTAVATVLIVDRLTRRIAPGAWDFLPAAFTAVLGLPLWTATSVHWDSTLAAAATCLCLVRWTERPDLIRLFLTGIMAGLTALFLQHKGVLAFLACGMVVFFWRGGGGWSWRAAMGRVAVLSLGPALIGAAVFLAFHVRGCMDALFHATVAMPLSAYHRINTVPYGFYLWDSFVPGLREEFLRLLPSSLGVPMWVAAVVVLCAAAYGPFVVAAALVWRRVAGPTRETMLRDSRTVSIALCGFALWLSELHRPDVFHLIWGSPLLAVVGFALLRSAAGPCSLFFRAACWALFAGTAAMATVSVLPAMGSGEWQETRRGSVKRLERDPCLDWLMRETAPKTPVFVYPYYPMYYFLADLRNPIRQSFITYGYHSPREIAAIIEALEAAAVPLVLWDRVVSHDAMRVWFPNYRAPSPEEQRIESYLLERYEQIGEEGDFRILRRKAP